MRPVCICLALLILSEPVYAQIDFSDYHDLSQVNAELDNLVSRFPSLATIINLGSSIEGRPIRAIKISDNPATDEPDEGDVIFVALHHAREWISVEMALYLAEYLLENYGADPQLTSDMNNLEIWVIPVMNPDGFEYTRTSYRYWRKNRRNNGDGTYGVDLNRNWGYEWGHDTGSSPSTFSEVYRGPSPFSEPETQVIRNLVQGVHNLKAFVTYHSFSELILAPWAYTLTAPPGELILDNHLDRSVALIAAVHGHSYGTSIGYLASGEATDYLWGETRTVALTPELRPASGGLSGFSPDPSEIIPNAEENLPMALALIHDAGGREVWIRDHNGDTGQEPSAVWTGSGWSEAFWLSPDIWTVPETLDQGATVDLNVRVHNNTGTTQTGVAVYVYYTDPRISLEFPNPDATLIGTLTVSVPSGGTTITIPWTVPVGTNSWGERHWCVGAVVKHATDMPLTTDPRRTSNIGIRNFETTEVVVSGVLLVAAVNYLDVASELLVQFDMSSIPSGWRVFLPPQAAGNPSQWRASTRRKAKLLGVRGLVLEPGQSVLLPVRVEPPVDVKTDTVFDINVHGALIPLVAGKREVAGSGYTFRVRANSTQER